MKKYSIILIALVCWGCASLNKQSSKNLSQKQQHLEQREQQQSTTKTTKVLLDTSSAAVEVAFWPKGRIKYSPITGFEGEAHQIKVKVKQQQRSLLSERKDQNLLANKEIAFKQEEHSKVKANLKDKTQHYFWMFGFLLTLGFCLVMVYLMYKRKLVWVKR